MLICRVCLFAVGHDNGIDETEIHVDPSTDIPVEETIRRAGVYLNRPNLLVSAIPRSEGLMDDYCHEWWPGTHPSVFPNGTGCRPKGLSEERWASGILRRYPLHQFARNTGFICDLFNVTQRHSVSKSAWLTFRFNPVDQAAVNELTDIDVQTVLETIGKKLFGASLENVLNSLPRGARKLYNGVRSAGGKVVGTPQSFMSLRSKVIAMPIVYGQWTTQMNLCPSENTSKWTFDATEEPYTLAFDGRPNNRPHITQVRRV